MAEIAWPSTVARIVSLALTPSTPGQIVHEIPSTGARRVLNRSAGRWSGSITFGQLDEAADGQRMEAFLAALDGSEHFVVIPLARTKLAVGPGAITITGGTSAGFSYSGRSLSDAHVGTYWNHGDRLLVATAATGASVTFWPAVTLPNRASVTPATGLKARGSGNAPLLPNAPRRFGPWTWQFVEAI